MTTKLAIIPPLSQSKQSLMACGYLYFERIIAGVSEADNKFALRGREVHQFLADYVNHLVASRQRQSIAHFNLMLDSSRLSPDAIDILSALRDNFEIDPEQVLCCEQRLYLDAELNPLPSEEIDAFAEPGDWQSVGNMARKLRVAYEGKPDLVLIHGNEAKIPDYKSQYQIVDAEDSFQGKFYSLLVMLHYEFVEKVTFELQFVRYGSARRSVTYTRGDIPHMKGLVARERDRQIQLHAQAQTSAASFEAMPGDHCAYCPLLHSTCPIKEQNVHAQESPADWLRFELWAKQAIKINEQRLRAHVNANGPVKVKDDNGNCYSREFELKERTTFPLLATLNEITDWIKQGGDDFTRKPDGSERLRIGATELKPMLNAKKRAPLAENVGRIRETEAYTQFSLKGSDEQEDDSAA